ncbi:protein kinase [Mycobacterium sp. 852002-51163_SCH5372311]|uniref:serine/threonine-protein kinase n=1 Tax=Mycobacterium sp. 852002-51163_SCH5372311 TaxID=1834097 RepID=UPI000A74F612
MADSRVGTTFGKYKIVGVVGKGGMGEVYEAYDNEIGRTVALKIIKSQYADDRRYRLRFERESRAAAKLQEPHVIPIHGVGEIDGCLFIDMRLVRGTDLQTILEEQPLDPERAVSIVSQIAAALDAAHADGLIHRDVKPQNILVTPADFAYLVDFGIAEVIGDTRLTQAGARIGSWAYMAPERFGDKEITPAVDIYSLACVLYECLTGALPFATGSQQAVIAAHLTAAPPRPSVTNPSVPPAFDEVIARGMAKEPDDRYGSAGALGRAATRALRGTGTQTAMPEAAPTQWTSRPAAQQRPPAQRPSPQPRSSAPQYFPPSGPDSAPTEVAPVAYSERRGGSRWVLPTVIAVAAALVLGAVGIIIGLLAKMNSTPAPTAEPSSSARSPSVASSGIQSPLTSTESLPSGNVPPPFMTGPDASPDRKTCDVLQLPDRTGFGTRAGRGSSRTSCFFANSVLTAYWGTYGNASLAARTVSAPGAVACSGLAGVSCDPINSRNFLMQCAGDGSNPWIKCTGGQDAVVYLW